MTQAQESLELNRYLELTPKSKALSEEGKRYLPGGDTRTSVYWSPYPLFMTHGKDCRLWDVDGTERIDFINNMTTLMLGHANPRVVQALQQQAPLGTAYAAPTEHQIRLAKILCERIPSLELVRFTNSGTEGTLNAIRAARAFTGKTKIAKAEGGYHGTHDIAEISVGVDPAKAGSPQRPMPVPASLGLSGNILNEVIIIPYNDIEASRQIILENSDELAAVIVEPIMGSAGMIPAQKDFLLMLREITEQLGIVLIFDEVISLRVGPGGAQEQYGVTPDLTAMGKMIGGGLPIGGFGGKAEIMELYDPSQGPRVPHAGTFQGNPMTMVAGVSAMEQLTPDVYDRMGELGDRLRNGIRDVSTEFEVPIQATGTSSLFALHFTDHDVNTYRDVATSDKALKREVFLGLLNEGIFSPPQLVGALSSPMGENEIDAFLAALRKVLTRRN